VRDDEAELVERCLAGEAAAFEALHAAHAGRVTGYLLRCGFAGADADDVAQEVFWRAFKSLRTFDPARGSLRTWLGAIARNAARKHWARRRPAGNFDPDLAEAMLAAPENPADRPEQREEIAAVRDCVDGLPADLARIVRLRYVEGLTTRGVAAAAGVPEATVRLRLTQAKGLLATCLRGKGFGPSGR